MAKHAVMTTKELAEYIKLNEKTVIKLAQNGQIPGVKIGNQWRFHLSAIDAYLQEKIVHAPDTELDMIINTSPDLVPLSRLTNHDLFELDSKAQDRKDVLSELAQLAYINKLTPSVDDLITQLGKREKMLSTAIGNGVAVPHPRHPSPELFKEPKIVILRTMAGINYGAPDNKPVYLFFMTCAPNEFVHLRLLAKISKLLHVSIAVKKLMRVKTKKEMFQILLEFDRDLQFHNYSKETWTKVV
jgi:excisionase family DNA binding protein